MDALTTDEVAKAVELIRAAGHGGDDARFPTVSLLEMPKADVLAWNRGDPFTRAAFVVMRHGGETFEIEVDLTAGQVGAVRKVDGQPTIIIDEWLLARELTLADPRWRDAMAQRGITDYSAITCSPLSAGYFRARDYDGRRILKVPCYQQNPDSSHLYGQPIAGLFTVVDVEAREVIEVVDLGIVEPAPEEPRERANLEPLQPVILSSPQGGNFKASGAVEVDWHNWSFHVRLDRRFGPIVSLVRLADGDQKRLVAYQMALSEIFVPYMDPQSDWSYRTYIDSGEFGAGGLLSSLMPGADCPDQAAFITAVVPNDKGQVFPVRRAACLFERNTGSPLWRHGSPARPTRLTRPQVELVLRTIPTIGNYDYIIDFVFTQHGNIDIRVGAAGIIAVKSVATGSMDDASAADDTKHGTLVAPGAVGVLHDHYFNFRLDLDVDGQDNTLVRDSVVAQRLPRDNPRRSIWVVEQSPIENEGPVSSDGREALWRVVNRGKQTALGHNPSFEIMPRHQTTSVLARDDDPQARAAFSGETLWVTRHHPKELYAAGAYPNLSRGGDGLPAYSGNGDQVVDTDLVVWFTVGFHHVPRVEDWPIMPVLWHGFTLRPFNFFNENPAYRVPPGFAAPPPPALRSTIGSDTDN